MQLTLTYDEPQPLVQITGARAAAAPAVRANTTTLLPLSAYARIIVNFSGGKDSLACVLYVMRLMREQGVPLDRLELWHQRVDGAPGGRMLMDWACTDSYVKAVAEALGLRIRFQWIEGGFEREMLRDDAPTAPITFEAEDGSYVTRGGTGQRLTRLKFPQKGAPGAGRWCSPKVKNDVAAMAVRNLPELQAGPVLVITGERREESALRSKYPELEEHRTSCQSRRVDNWHAIVGWTEAEVWAVIREARIMPHVAYYLGFGRVSCATCIFGTADHWATIRLIMPDRFERMCAHEDRFGVTLDRSRTLRELADRGTPFVDPEADADLITLALISEAYTAADIILPAGVEWQMPRGAFRSAGGPS